MNLTSQKYLQDLRRYYRLPVMQVSLTLVLSLLVMAVFIVFALRPTILSIVTLKKTIVESEKTLKTLDTKISNLQKASSQLDAIKGNLPTLNKIVPNEGAMYSPLTKALEGLATETETKLDSETLGATLLYSRTLSPFTPNKSQTTVALPLTIRVTGGYPNAIVFLDKLLAMERMVAIETITITKEVGAKDSAPVVSLNITGNAYYLADSTQLQKIITTPKGKK